MSQILANMQAAIAAAAATAADMTEAQKGGGGGRLLPAGYAFGQLVEYIEFGAQPQEYNGVAKDPAMEVQLGFALSGTGYSNDDGTPYIVRPYSMALSRNEKAGAFLLFRSLNWKGTKKHFGEMLGDKFLVKVVHVPKSKVDKTVVSRIDLKGFLPPLDPVTKMPYQFPDAPDSLYKWFFWDTPTLADWDALYVAGTFDDGGSKNKIQGTILGAVDFAGSPLEALFAQAGKPIPVVAKGTKAAAPAVPAAMPAVPQPAAPAAPAVPNVPPAPVAAPVVPSVPVVAAMPAPVMATAVPAVPAMPSVPVPPSVPVTPAMPSVPTV